MVDLPDPEQKYGDVVLEPPKPQVSGQEVLQEGMLRANALKSLASGAERGFAPIIGMLGRAVQSGTAAAPDTAAQITRGPSGDLSVQPSLTSLFGQDPSDTLTHSAVNGALATATLKSSSDIAALGQQFAGDPEGFKKAGGAYVGSSNWDGLGSIGGAAKANAGLAVNQTYQDLVTRRAAANTVDSKNAISSQIDQTSNDMSTLAKNGQLNSPQYDHLQDRLQDSYAALARNPAFGLSKADADNQLAQRLNGFLGDHVSSQIDAAYQTGGKAGAIQAAIGGVNSIPNLSAADRAQLTQQAASRVDYVSGLNSDAIQANRSAADHAIKAANIGVPVDPAAYGGISSRAIMTGDPGTVSIIAGHVPATAVNPIAAGLSPSQSSSALKTGVQPPPPPIGGPTRQAQAYNYFVSKGWSPNAAHAMTATLSGESGQELNPLSLNTKENTGGIFGGSFGLANWDAHRQGNLVKEAGSVEAAKTFQAQLVFVEKEARQYGLPINSTASPAALTSIFTGRFEAPTVNNGAQRWANYAKVNLQGGGAPASVNGQPLPAGHSATPMAATPYAASVASDPAARAKTANDLGGSIERSLQNHQLPAPEDMAQYVQLAAGDPKEKPRATRIAEAAGFPPSDGGGASSTPAPSGAQPETYQQTVGRLAAGHDLYQAGIGSAMQQQHSDASAALAHDPIGYAAKSGFIQPNQVPGPINFSDPNAISQGIQARAAIVSRVAAREPGMSLSAIPEAEKPQLTDWMTYGPPQTAQAILDSIKALPTQSRDATLADPQIAKAVVNMAHSGDATRAGAANDLLTEAWKTNPQTFDHKFGEGASSDLAAWHSVGQFQSPEQLAESAKIGAQPAVIKARNDEVAVANKMTPASIANALSKSWFGPNATPGDTPSGAALKGQYDDLFHEQYLKTGDATASKDYALGKLTITWGPSVANGGRVMMHPPEYSQAYPFVDGNKSYIGDQLAADVASAAPGSTDHYLIPDQRTADEMHSGQRPTYPVIVKDASGRWGALPGRFAADPERAKEDAATKFGSRHTALGIISTTGFPSGHF